MQTRLLHLCDSLFPIGGFAFSDGLEAAAARHLIRDAGELGAWLDTVLDESVGRCEGPAGAPAWGAVASGRGGWGCGFGLGGERPPAPSGSWMPIDCWRVRSTACRRSRFWRRGVMSSRLRPRWTSRR